MLQWLSCEDSGETEMTTDTLDVKELTTLDSPKEPQIALKGETQTKCAKRYGNKINCFA